MKLLLEVVITSSIRNTCTVFFVILLENLACWRGTLRWSSKELRGEGKQVPPPGRNGRSRYQKRALIGSLPSLLRVVLCAAEVSSSAFPSWWCYWQSAARLQRECQSQQGCFCVQCRNQLFGTPSDDTWFPNKGGMLNPKSFWKSALCHETWWIVWVFPKLFCNLAARRLCRSFQGSFQFCILLDAALKYFSVLQSLVRAGGFIIYFDSHQLILSNSTHYCSIWQVLLLKSFSFFSPSFEWGFYICCLVYLPKESMARFLVDKSFVFVATFRWQVKQLLVKIFSWFNLNFAEMLMLWSDGR